MIPKHPSQSGFFSHIDYWLTINPYYKLSWAIDITGYVQYLVQFGYSVISVTNMDQNIKLNHNIFVFQDQYECVISKYTLQ